MKARGDDVNPTISRRGDWLSAKVGEDLVMMSAQTGDYVTLSRVGGRLWELVETPQTLEALCRQLVCEFDVTPEQCRADVEAFLEEMERHGVVSFGPASGG
jgi:hypothetical protein